ncbi:hypothetical protein AGMMS49992_32120 [Clostridia bacterium]|nr:hypothetical protein AGMMS49992_32120 [Clostridia bacterium]
MSEALTSQVNESEPVLSPNQESAGVQTERTFDEWLTDNKTYQAEFDRRVSQALNKRQAEWQKELTSQLSQARTEAEKLARMTAEQRAAHESEQREADYASRLQELTRRELRAQAADTLAGRGLPLKLLATLNLTDADACKASIEAVEEAYRESVEDGIKDRLRGTAPKAGTPGKADDYAGKLRAAMGLKG